MVLFHDIVTIPPVKHNTWKLTPEELRIHSGNGRKTINNNFLKAPPTCLMDGKPCVCEHSRLVTMKLEFEFQTLPLFSDVGPFGCLSLAWRDRV